MAKVVLTLTLLSLFFAFTLARANVDIPENDVIFLDLSNSKPTLLLPSDRTIYQPNTVGEETGPQTADDKKPFPFGNDALIADELEQKSVEIGNDGVGVAEEDDRRRVEGENDDVVVELEVDREGGNDGVVAVEEEQKKPTEELPETQTLDLKQPLTSVRFWQVNRHFRRPCHHWMKHMMRMRHHRIHGDDMMVTGRAEEGKAEFDREFFRGGERKEVDSEMGQFHGFERKELEEEEQKPVEVENDGVLAAEEVQKPAEPETQTLDLKRPLTVAGFPLVNRHFRRPCHHWMKPMMMMRHHRMHGREMPYDDMIHVGGEKKVFDREFSHGGERKEEVDSEMEESRDGETERKKFISDTFRGGERKELDREMFRGIGGDRMHEMRPQWMGFHHEHHHHHHDHEGRPWFPFFGRHHHHDHHDHDHHERFGKQISSGRPFFRGEEMKQRREDDQGREEGGFLDRIRGFITNHF